ncbi:sigma-70 family RNA polymerase sigma factor [Pseudonocardia halophobica]|uniref:RNA polymerase sigma factor SigK n=1 Tax=Pseudonocardia halophobica TaxID=29401 RepID=A0A9W6L662_9PSEU|nr:sigma-70 family RNA polymerase sigma factor [Pseudonocardia halophobica]GLL14371.1 RNA polymerase sigma factor SigK [Pseudonocardia halophobica]
MNHREAAARTGRTSGPDDSVDLLAGVAEGRRDALARLYDRYGRQAWSLARRICGDDALAEDAVQEAFTAVWREAGRFDPRRGRASTWLMTLVHHKAVDLVRREDTARRRTVPMDDDTDLALPRLPGADVDALGAVAAGTVRSALDALPADQRHALALAYFGGYTQREVATLTGVPLGTVKSRMFAGLGRLRTALGPVLGEDDVR